MSTVRIVGTVPLRPNWTGRLTLESWTCWARLDALLRWEELTRKFCAMRKRRLGPLSFQPLTRPPYLPDFRVASPQNHPRSLNSEDKPLKRFGVFRLPLGHSTDLSCVAMCKTEEEFPWLTPLKHGTGSGSDRMPASNVLLIMFFN